MSVADDFLYALRSGDYKQGRGRYYNLNTDCYCAIGVWLDMTETPRDFNNNFHDIDTINKKIEEFESIFDVCAGTIMIMNDSRLYLKSFEEIADYLESRKKA